MKRARRTQHACVVAGWVALRVASAVAAPQEPPAGAPEPPKETAAPAQPSQEPAAAPHEAAPAQPPAEAAAAPEAAVAAAPPPPAAPPPQKDTAAEKPKAAPPEKGIPSSLEATFAIGPSYVTSEGPANPEYTQSFSRVGVFGELALAYRSKYFIDPFLGVGYAMLASGQSQLPAGPWGSGGTMEQHLSAWIVAPGITSDIWRIRLRLGLGFAFVDESFDFNGTHNSTTQFALSNQGAVGFNLLDVTRFRLDAEARFVGIPGADLWFTTIAVVARGDVLVFGSTQ